MTSFKNLKKFWGDNEKDPLDDTAVRDRIIMTLTNFGQHPKKYGYHRDLDNIIGAMVSDVLERETIISKLRKKSSQLTSQLWNLTRKRATVKAELVALEREKRLKLATTSFLSGINKNYITKKIQPSQLRFALGDLDEPIPPPEKSQSNNFGVKNLASPFLDSKADQEGSKFSAVLAKNPERHSQKDLYKTSQDSNKLISLNDKTNRHLSKLNTIKSNTEVLTNLLAELDSEIEKNLQFRKHKINILTDSVYAAIKNDSEYVQERGVKGLLVKLHRVTGEIDRERLPSGVGEAGKDFLIKLSV